MPCRLAALAGQKQALHSELAEVECAYMQLWRECRQETHPLEHLLGLDGSSDSDADEEEDSTTLPPELMRATEDCYMLRQSHPELQLLLATRRRLLAEALELAK